MAKAYYSTVFEQKAADVWKIVRDFNSGELTGTLEGWFAQWLELLRDAMAG